MNALRHLFLIEDDEVDTLTIQKALAELDIPLKLSVYPDAEAALAGMPTQLNSGSWPSLILLDIKMPRLDGVAFLKKRQEDPLLLQVPVVVLTTSELEEDLNRCYQFGASGYLVKPVSYAEFLPQFERLTRYWLQCQFPSQPSESTHAQQY